VLWLVDERIVSVSLDVVNVEVDAKVVVFPADKLLGDVVTTRLVEES
jgi:hypothetical protein